jgi:hypothetical protein
MVGWVAGAAEVPGGVVFLSAIRDEILSGARAAWVGLESSVTATVTRLVFSVPSHREAGHRSSCQLTNR